MAIAIPGFYLSMSNDGNCEIVRGSREQRTLGQMMSAITISKGEVPLNVWKGSDVQSFVFESGDDVFGLQVMSSVIQTLYDQVPDIVVYGMDVIQDTTDAHKFWITVRYTFKNDQGTQKIFSAAFFDAGA
jgi:hypothetical protein